MEAIDNKLEIDVASALTNGRFRRVSQQWTRKQKYFPNEVWHSEADRVTLIVAKNSARPESEFSLNANVLNDILNHVQAGRVEQAFVVFVEDYGSGDQYFGHAAVEAMAAMLDGSTPFNGKHGAYWWIERDVASGKGGYVPAELLPLLPM